MLIGTSISSCGQTSQHDKDIKYYTTIALQMKDLDNSEQIRKTLFYCKAILKKETSKRISSSSFDKLNNALTSALKEIDIRIKKISALNDEGDEKYNLKKTVLSYWTRKKESCNSIFPIFLQMLKNNDTNLTEAQKNEIEKSTAQMKKLQLEEEEIEILFIRYCRLHDITTNELEEYDL
jgi:hypothetical protein